MAQYDPIIHFYDDPGHPYWPNKDGSSGGGGGVELGPLQLFPLVYVGADPTVGRGLETEACSLDIKAGDIEVVEGGKVASNTVGMKIAANMTITLYVNTAGVSGVNAVYVVTHDGSIRFPKITDVTEWDGECTFTPGGDYDPSVTFMMPELGENQVLAFKLRAML